MKNLKYVFIMALAFIFGCSDYLDINTSPNNAADAEERLIIPAAQQSVAYCVGNNYRITGSIWSQHYTQSNQASQYITIDNYDVANLNFLENDFIELNSGALNDLAYIKQKAKLSENWTNYLIAQVMEAYAYQLIVDLYDGAPLTEGHQGSNDNFTPIWDEGPVVYDSLISRLDYALSKDFGASTDQNPSTSDLLFGGDVESWVRFANTLKLKLLIRNSAVNPAKAQTEINSLVNSGASFLSEDAGIFSYTNTADRSNPLFEADRRDNNTTTNLKASASLVSYLELNSDSRINSIFDFPTLGGPVRGQRQGTSSVAGSVLDSRAVSGAKVLPTDPVYFISLPEAYFLRAEAAARGFSNEDAKSLYDAGVLAAFDRYGLNGSSYIATGGAYEYPNGSVEQNVEAIIEQKWIAHAGGNSLEAWFDMLRTGYPSFSSAAPGDAAYDPLAPGAPIFSFPVDAVTFNGQFPRRLFIPEDEILNNPNAPAQPAEGILTSVWWDVN